MISKGEIDQERHDQNLRGQVASRIWETNGGNGPDRICAKGFTGTLGIIPTA